jgi:organic hydroperoxide reductase OsmC/OhrA
MEAHYQLDLNWLYGRKGELSSPDLDQQLEVATPPEFPEGIPGIWSPEHLFTASVCSCFMTTFLAVAKNSGLEYTSFDCHASGKLEQVDGVFMMTEVLLEPSVTILSDSDFSKAERVLLKSEKLCLITHSIKAEVKLIPHIVVEAEDLCGADQKG